MKACVFTFDYGPSFAGFTDGTAWNGFTNVWVTAETRALIAENFSDDPACDELNEDLLALPIEDGLVSLANGWATWVM